MATNDQIAKALQASRYHTYPNGGTIRSQSQAMIRDLEAVLRLVRDGEDLPPWTLMKLSESADAVSSVSRYIQYHAQK